MTTQAVTRVNEGQAGRQSARYTWSKPNYTDGRSQRQIGAYLMHANDTAARNATNLRRWHDEVAWQWYEIGDVTPV